MTIGTCRILQEGNLPFGSRFKICLIGGTYYVDIFAPNGNCIDTQPRDTIEKCQAYLVTAYGFKPEFD